MTHRKRENELFEYYSKLVAGDGGMDSDDSNKRMKTDKSPPEVIEINSLPGSPISEDMKSI